MRRTQGFTLIELMIVVAIIAIVASIALPSMIAARRIANETSAIATMRSIAIAQTQFKVGGKADVDSDGIGEFGFFAEMTGRSLVRNSYPRLNSPVLSLAFQTNSAGTADWFVVGRSGYLYHIELPGPGGLGIGEFGAGSTGGAAFFGGTIDDELSENHWLCYAKPASYGTTGVRSFFINQSGDILQTNEPFYTGLFNGPIRTAAFVPGTFGITGKVAIGTLASDGNIWRSVN